MKRIFTAVAMSAMLAVGVLPVRANEMGDHGMSMADRQKHMDKHMERMTKDLNLTPDQQTSVRKAMETKMEKMDTAWKDYDRDVRAVLNPDQVKKYDEMKEDMGDRMKSHMKMHNREGKEKGENKQSK